MYKINPFVEKGTDNTILQLGSLISKEGKYTSLRQSFCVDDRNPNEAMFSDLEHILPVKGIALSPFIIHRKIKFLLSVKSEYR